MQTVRATEHRLSRAWYVRYPFDAYALGPYRFAEPVSAEVVSDQALEQFGERPAEVWPDGPVRDTDEYEFELAGTEADTT